MPELGWGLPYNLIIDHEMNVLWGAAANFEGAVATEAIGIIENALGVMNEAFPEGPGDDDGDGLANGCDPCPNSHLHFLEILISHKFIPILIMEQFMCHLLIFLIYYYYQTIWQMVVN